MKKFISIILCLTLFLTLLQSVAAAGVITVYTDTLTANAGETLKLPVRFSENAGIMGFRLDFDYDSNILTPLSVEYANTISSGLQDNIDGDAVPGSMRVYWAGDENVTAEGIWFYINFAVNPKVASQQTKINVSYSQADTFDENFNDVILNISDFSVNIVNSSYSYDAQFNLSSPTVVAGDEFLLELKGDITNSINSLTVTLNYDFEKFTFAGIENNAITVTPSNENGKLTLTLKNISTDLSGVELAQIKFRCNENTIGGNYNITASAASNGKEIFCSDSVISVISGAYSGAVIYTEPVSALQGDSLTIPVMLKNNSGIMGFRLTFSYNANVLEPVSVERGEKLSGGNLEDSIGVTDENSFDVVWNSTDDLTENGSLFLITFNVKSPVDFQNADINITYSQEDTFNEKYEDVKLICNKINVNISALKVTEKYNSYFDIANKFIFTDMQQCNNISELLTVADGYSIQVTPSKNTYLGSKTSIDVTDNASGTKTESYTLLVMGDSNGDSVCDVLDVSKVSQVVTNVDSFSDENKFAADFDKNGIIDLSDYQSIVNHALS